MLISVENIDRVAYSSAFCRLGSQVTVFARRGRVLPKEDEDVADLLQAALSKEGVSFVLDVEEYTKASLAGDQVELGYRRRSASDGEAQVFDAILIAAGRKPNVG